MTIDQLKARREEIIALARRRGAHNVRLFGSIARGDQNPASDVDLLVDFEAGRSLLDLTALWLELDTRWVAKSTSSQAAAFVPVLPPR